MSLEYLFTVWIALWTQVKTTWTCMWWWLVLSIFELMRSFHVASHYFLACMNFAFSSNILEKSIWTSKQEALFVACSIQAYLPCLPKAVFKPYWRLHTSYHSSYSTSVHLERQTVDCCSAYGAGLPLEVHLYLPTALRQKKPNVRAAYAWVQRVFTTR